MDIHERLQYLRKQLKLTTRAFGASINMSGGAITNMEKGTEKHYRSDGQRYMQRI